MLTLISYKGSPCALPLGFTPTRGTHYVFQGTPAEAREALIELGIREGESHGRFKIIDAR